MRKMVPYHGIMTLYPPSQNISHGALYELENLASFSIQAIISFSLSTQFAMLVITLQI